MSYTITYTVDTLPADLPEGAEVTKVSDLPYTFVSERGATLGVTASKLTAGACIMVDEHGPSSVHLTAEATRKVMEALAETLDTTEPVEEGHIERRLIDGDDSVWFELSPGLWTLGSTLEQAKDNRSALLAFGHSLENNYADWSLGRIEAMYGIVVRPYAIR